MNHSELDELVPIGTAVHRRVNFATARCRIRFLPGFGWCDYVIRNALLKEGICAESYEPECPPSRTPRVNDLLAVAIVGAQSERFYEVHLEMWNGEEWRCIQTGEIVKDRSELCWPFSSSHDSLMVHPDFKARKAIERNWTWPVESDGK